MKDKEYTKEETLELFKSLRGHFIVGKALYVAVQTLEKEKYPPTSDIEQMKEIGEKLFPIGYIGAEASEKFSDKEVWQELQKNSEKCEEQ